MGSGPLPLALARLRRRAQVRRHESHVIQRVKRVDHVSRPRGHGGDDGSPVSPVREALAQHAREGRCAEGDADARRCRCRRRRSGRVDVRRFLRLALSTAGLRLGLCRLRRRGRSTGGRRFCLTVLGTLRVRGSAFRVPRLGGHPEALLDGEERLIDRRRLAVLCGGHAVRLVVALRASQVDEAERARARRPEEAQRADGVGAAGDGVALRGLGGPEGKARAERLHEFRTRPDSYCRRPAHLRGALGV
mmetsp:Transcript_17981/g.52461  ORF Transcript_17981/g.52461 Transcript_17981/m.52461 type:complete len:248 (+) Transcript_17981:1453-2196(+)